MRVAGVIPARWGSTRLPGKSLVPICGKPLIQWVAENASKAKELDCLMVATDDERIYDLLKKLDIQVVMTRDDHPSGTDRVAEAIEKLDVDAVINIQGDEPLIDPKLIDALARKIVLENDLDMVTAAVKIENEEDLSNSSVVKVVFDEKGHAMYFSRSVIPHVRDNIEGEKVLHWRHIGIYAYRKSFLDHFVKTPPCDLEIAEKLEQLRALYIGGRMAVVEADDAGIGVDTPEDVKFVESIIRVRK